MKGEGKMGEVILTMKGIDKSFPGVHALDHVDLELRKGEVHALMGENGAGKSTLMKVLTGIYTKDSGSRQIRKIFILMITGNAIYFAWKLIIAVIKQEVSSFFYSVFTIKNIAKLIIFNQTHLQSHLWYLGAILYVLVFVTIIFRWNEKKAQRLLLYATPILLLGNLIMGKYSLCIFNEEFPYFFSRNWLFDGLPFFCIGMLIKNKEIRIEKRKLIYIIILSFLTTVFERFFLDYNNLNTTRDFYLSTAFLATSIFLFFLDYIENTDNIVSLIGRRYSTWIYILHPIFIKLLGKITKQIGMKYIFSPVRPIVVFLITAFVVDLFIRIQEKMNQRKS